MAAKGSWKIEQYGDEFKLVLFNCNTNGGQKSTRARIHDLYEAYFLGNGDIISHPEGAEFVENCSASERMFDLWKREELARMARKDAPPSRRLSQSISRARSRVFELARCNEWDYFITLTLDRFKQDRHDLDAYRSQLGMMVRNLNRKQGYDIKYLLVPEQHKDGAWHLHGFIRGIRDDDLNPNRNGFLEWTSHARRFGFTSLSRIRSHEACSRYITKYVSKDWSDSMLRSGAHLFCASQGLNGRTEVRPSAPGRLPELDWDYINEYVKIRWFRNQDELVKALMKGGDGLEHDDSADGGELPPTERRSTQSRIAARMQGRFPALSDDRQSRSEPAGFGNGLPPDRPLPDSLPRP